MYDRANSSVFKDFLKSGRDGEERTSSSKLFQTALAAAEKLIPPMIARQVREIAKTVDNVVVDVCEPLKLAAVVSTGTQVLNCEGRGR